MIGFEQKITSITEILIKIENLINNSNLLIILIVAIFITIISITYVFPILHLIKAHIIKDNKKKDRKEMLRQISLQKEIEDEIEKEL